MINTTTPIRFVPFNDALPVRHYQTGYLPHLRQKGCTYFATFRLADSVPVGRLNQWKQERHTWLSARNIDVTNSKWKEAFLQLSIQDRQVYERNFASKLFESLDEGFGESWLKQKEVQGIVAAGMRHFDGIRLHLGDFVIMPNHVHALMTPIDGFELEEVLHSVKSWTANQVNGVLSRTGELWMKDSFDRLVRDGEELLRIQQYIRRNPVKAKLIAGEFYLETKEYDSG